MLKVAPRLRADATEWKIIELLPGYPIVTGPLIKNATKRSEPAVYRALDNLELGGVLIPLSQGSRNRSWKAAGLLELMEGLEDGTEP